MWFRPGNQSSVDSDRLSVSSLKKRIRNAGKSSLKSSSLEASGNVSKASSIDDINEKSTNKVARASRAATDPPTRKLTSKSTTNSEKEKALDDRKFRNNKVMKSTSKTKIADLAKAEHQKGRTYGTSRKTSAPPILNNSEIISNCSAAVKKNVSAYSNQLNALYKLVSSNRKLSREEFERLRKKSLTEAGVAGKITTLDSENPNLISVDQGDSTSNEKTGNEENYKDKTSAESITTDEKDSDKNNETEEPNGDKVDEPKENCDNGTSSNNNNNNINVDAKSISEGHDSDNISHKKVPSSLSSRVAAKISETTNNYKNRRSKPLKKRKSSRRLELYKQISIDRPLSASVARQPSDRRPDSSAQISGGSATASGQSEWTSQSVDSETNPLDVEPETSKKERSKSKSAPVSVNRSESYKERLSQKRSRNNRRKTSDPSLTKTNDEQDLALSNHAGSCSSSSLSSTSLESPSISLEQVTGPSISNSINISQLAATATSGVTSRQWLESEEEEPDHLETDWSSNVAAEILATLSDIEKKRQEIINEIYQTERSHVRTLKLLDRIFMRPLLESGVLPHDHLQSLFPPGLLSLKDIHSAFEYKLKQRRSEHGHVVRTLGDLLSEMFEGRIGEDLREYAAQVCAHQQIALEALKEKRRKDENLHRFLAKAESHKSCRRLQLKDLLPTVLQRLTKYPLLFENLVSITKRVDPDNSAEVDAIQRALDSSKRILVYVNQAVKAAEDAHKLQTIQRKLDKSSIDKDLSELRNLDLTQYKLIYDGHLQLKKIPSVQLHGLLFENMMVLLQKLDDKYLLRSFPHTLAGGGEGFISPITHFDQQTLVRQSAVDKNTFFLIITKTSQMLELKAPSSSECKTWFKHISDAAEQYKPRSKSSHDVAEDPASATLPHSNTKESLESATDRLPTETPTPDIANVSRQAADQQSATRSNNDNVTDPGTEPNTKESQRDSQKLSNDKNSDKETTTATDKNSQTEQANKKCDSSSTLYSNNSNNTRTLTQHCALLEPSEIQISISPAHTAEPVLTNSERLRRLDDKIRSDLLEKERIICDMFRVPHEHFAAIVDIASQPEAPKDTSNIALAAFAHVQTLTELVNQFMKITPEQEISAVSTAVCDRCYLRTARGASPMPPAVNVVDSTTAITTNLVSPTQAECDVYDDKIIQEDDGYCQIDELRLPSIGATMAASQPIPVASSSDSSTSDATPTVSSVESKEVNTNAQQSGVGSGKDASEQMEKSATKKIDVASEVPSEGIQKEQSKVSDNSSVSEDILQHDDHDTTTSSTKCPIDKNDASQSVKCQFVTGVNELSQSCGPNRFSHAHSLGPSVPCHVISGIVTALSSQISLLLPKINERDIERERLRRENQNLRELLNSMHARQRVEEEKETPENIKSADNPPT